MERNLIHMSADHSRKPHLGKGEHANSIQDILVTTTENHSSIKLDVSPIKEVGPPL